MPATLRGKEREMHERAQLTVQGKQRKAEAPAARQDHGNKHSKMWKENCRRGGRGDERAAPLLRAAHQHLD